MLRQAAACVALLSLCPPAPLQAQNDPPLQRALDSLVTGFRGTAGVYVRHLRTGQAAGINQDSVFPTASMVKVPILIGTFDAIERGQLDFHQEMTYTDSLLYPGEDLIGSLEDSAKVKLSKLTLLMITTSDNTASLWLQALAGTGTVINQWLADHGFDSTRVNSRTPGREANREQYGWGQTTPREMAELLAMIRQGWAVSPAASEEMYRHLTRSYYTAEALSALPPWVQVASKVGAVNRSRSEVVLVNAPSGDYVFCIITKNQEDQSWDPSNEGYVLIRKLSALLWNHFEPAHPWQPAEGVGKFKPGG
ncbi:MAG: class A beta-lactamase-related serine hydrolase [Gemmatimonadota bacterium]|nr:class A beta-lactamase-related serine hydrolase [Gemmatimonadota bacterium]